MDEAKRNKYFKLNIKFTLVILAFTIVPIAVMSGILFANSEKDVLEESRTYMEYKMERDAAQLKTDIDSINMSTRFFSADEGLLEFLKDAKNGKTLDAKSLIGFRDSEVAELERMVNNNPLLYAVRVYSVTEIREMMPVLYGNSRLKNLEWADDEDITGWHFGYYDTLFSSLTTNQKKGLTALVTVISDYDEGTLGYIEAAMTMDTCFPSLYEKIEDESGFFVTEDGVILTGNADEETAKLIIDAVAKETGGEISENGLVLYEKLGKRSYTITCYPVKSFAGTLYGVKDVTGDIGKVKRSRNIYVAIMVAMLIVIAIVINGIVKGMLKQFYSILKGIRRVQKGDLEVRVDESGRDEMAELGSQLNKMLDRIRNLMDENIKREVLVKNSEIRSLQNQINAHFIYNVLESVKMMAEIDEEYEISDAITALGKMLRYSMKWVSGNVILSEELEYIRNYLKLMNLRYDFEVILSVNIPEELMDQEIPKMSLQPIVENAVLHGIEPVMTDTTVYIKARQEGSEFIVEVTDSGRGMTEDELKHVEEGIRGEVETAGGKGNGIGLKNVEDRIRLSFGKEYGLSIYSEYGKYTKVSVRLPRKSGGGTAKA